MEIKWVQLCPICNGADFAKIVRGYEGNPINFLKCTKCGREIPEPEQCEDGACKI